jgi:hypothetical protein
VGAYVIERSSDAGRSWRRLTFGGPAAAALPRVTAGASPSPTICWWVGREGTVLLIDGDTVRVIPFPETAPLVRVRARSGTEATVGTADGREFSTDDGGRIWTLDTPQRF